MVKTRRSATQRLACRWAKLTSNERLLVNLASSSLTCQCSTPVITDAGLRCLGAIHGSGPGTSSRNVRRQPWRGIRPTDPHTATRRPSTARRFQAHRWQCDSAAPDRRGLSVASRRRATSRAAAAGCSRLGEVAGGGYDRFDECVQWAVFVAAPVSYLFGGERGQQHVGADVRVGYAGVGEDDPAV